MSDTSKLSQVITNFLSAEQALAELAGEQARLAAAASDFHKAAGGLAAAEKRSTERTRDSLSELEKLREQLRAHLEGSANWTQQSAETDQAIAAAAQKMKAVLDTLLEINPEAMSRDLAEMRRADADNASELREVRRLVADIERAARTLKSGQLETQRGQQLLVRLQIATLVSAAVAAGCAIAGLLL